MASPEEQQAFSDEVAATEIPTEVGDIKMEDLPGPEALLDPGNKLYHCVVQGGLDVLHITSRIYRDNIQSFFTPSF